MRVQERVYRALLVAYPKEHRREYGEPMMQMMRDRLRDEGGGWRTGLVWAHLLADLARNALAERTATAVTTIKTGWWRILAALIAIVIAGAVIASFVEPEPATGPWWKDVFGTAALIAAPIATLVGLVMWRRHRTTGNILIGLGVLPGCAAVVLFWHPLFLGFGIVSIRVLAAALDDLQRPDLTVAAPPTTD